MSVRAFARTMRELFEQAKAQGTAAIFIDNLIAVFRDVENSPEPVSTPAGMEQYKAKLQHWIEEQKQEHEHRREMFRSVVTSGQNAIKTAMLLNGGAAVAILAFIGHLTKSSPDKVAAFGPCLLPFAAGSLVITITSGFAYLSQWFYAHETTWSQRCGLGCNILCILLAFGSYALFSWGIFRTYETIQSVAWASAAP